jgi:hypothetical protein
MFQKLNVGSGKGRWIHRDMDKVDERGGVKDKLLTV